MIGIYESQDQGNRRIASRLISPDVPLRSAAEPRAMGSQHREHC